jgi:hypothetical protein
LRLRTDALHLKKEPHIGGSKVGRKRPKASDIAGNMLYQMSYITDLSYCIAGKAHISKMARWQSFTQLAMACGFPNPSKKFHGATEKGLVMRHSI